MLSEEFHEPDYDLVKTVFYLKKLNSLSNSLSRGNPCLHFYSE